MKIRLGFNSNNTLHRQLLVTVDQRASLNYDWGFDAKNLDEQIDDMYWIIQQENYLIQGVDLIDQNTVLPIGIHTRDNGINTITIDALVNTPEDFKVYLHDKQLDIYHDLTDSDYQIELNAGEYLERFEISFANQALSTEEVQEQEQLEAYFANDSQSIIINNPRMVNINDVEIINMIGQKVYTFENIELSHSITLKTKSISAGAYIIKLNTDNGIISKKVLMN